MRSTIHLLTAADALALRPLVDVVIERMTTSAFGRHLTGVDRSALVKAARALVDSHADRSRVLRPEAVEVYAGFAARNKQPSAVLVDGLVAATWAVTRDADGHRDPPLRSAERESIEAEGVRLLAFLHSRDAHDVVVDDR
jgi:hypothetical protein